MDEARIRELISDVDRDITAHEKELDDLRRLRNYLSRQLSLPLVNLTGTLPATTISPPSNGVSNNAPNRYAAAGTVARAVEMVLRESGPNHPLRAMEIVDLLIAGGYPGEHSRALSNTVFSAMARDAAKFGKVGRGLWTLVEFLNATGEHSLNSS